MPCRFVARGESIGLLAPDGSRDLRQIIRSLLSNVGSGVSVRIEGIVSLSEGDCEFALDVSDGKVVMACVDRGKELLGDDAVKELREILSERPSRGYVEAVKLSDAALELDVGSAPLAVLGKPVPLQELLAVGVGEQPRRKDGEEGEEGKEGEGLGARGGGSRELVRGINTLTDSSPDVMRGSPEVFLANIVMRSKTIDISTNGTRLTSLINKARELSSSRTDKVYRLAVTLKSGETYNAFFHGGKPCVLLKHTSFYDGVERLEPDIEECLGKLPEENIKYILLCEVTEPLIVRSVENSCTPFPNTSAVRVPERSARKGKKGKRGFLSRILGR